MTAYEVERVWRDGCEACEWDGGEYVNCSKYATRIVNGTVALCDEHAGEVTS